MAAPLIQATAKAGEYLIAALGRTVKLVEWREDDFYDTVVQVAGAITAGTQLVLFRDVQTKSRQHCNLVNPSRIPSGAEMVMNRVGVLINQAFGNVVAAGGDIMKIAYGGSFTFNLNQTRLIAQGPLVKFQTGYGITGATTDTTANSFTTGVPSASAAPQLLVAQPITSTDDLGGEVRFESAAWAAGFAMPTTTVLIGITAFLHGLIKRPIGS
jgi:hypothetical protein